MNFVKVVDYKPYILDIINVDSNIFIPILISVLSGSPEEVSDFSKSNIVTVDNGSRAKFAVLVPSCPFARFLW